MDVPFYTFVIISLASSLLFMYFKKSVLPYYHNERHFQIISLNLLFYTLPVCCCVSISSWIVEYILSVFLMKYWTATRLFVGVLLFAYLLLFGERGGVGLFALLAAFISNIFQLTAGFTLIVLSCNIYPTVLWLLLQSSYPMCTSYVNIHALLKLLLLIWILFEIY